MNTPPNNKRSSGSTALFAVLVVCGFALRGAAAWYSWGVHHADEHQQYVEQAQRLAFGYGVRFWEQDRRIRNELYPLVLAGILKVLDGVGIHSPIAQAILLRVIVSWAVFGCLVLFAWRMRREGRKTAALIFVGLAALIPDCVYVNVRLLTENAAIVPLVAALLWYEKRPFLAGIACGAMFAIRFQTILFAFAFLALAASLDWRRQTLALKTIWQMALTRMILGLVVSVVLFVGLLDYFTQGQWFVTPVESFRIQVIDKVAADYGVSPWYSYILWYGIALLKASVLSLGILALGMIREWKIAFVAGVFVAGHSAIGHKEPRFLWSALPLLLAVLASGLEFAWLWRGDRRWKGAVFAASLLSLVLGYGFLKDRLQWTKPSFRGAAEGLVTVGRLDDATGVLVTTTSHNCGNYFYLRRRIPLLSRDNRLPLGSMRDDLEKAGTDINYLVCREGEVKMFSRWQPILMRKAYIDWGVYRLRWEPSSAVASKP